MDPNDLSSQNPLFSQPPKKDKVVEPLHGKTEAAGQDNPAADLIRQKLSTLYSQEPSATEEINEAREAGRRRSKHQQFMYDLSRSGKSLAEIQTAWHNYYVSLPDNEKHEVWQEFYTQHTKLGHQQASHQPSDKAATPQAKPIHHKRPTTEQPTDLRPVSAVKDQLLGRIQTHTKRRQQPSHLRSLTFGLSMGGLVVLILLFSFFNERFIAPFITPSRSVSNTPIIIDPSTTAAGKDPKIIIPKINVEIPVIYDEPSIDEHAVQRALEDGVLHYATTPSPGELGNGVIFGHSSNNILNKGKYKFAFVLLKRLETGDTFILQKDGKRYVYKVYDKKIVAPEEVSVLNTASKPATFTLITCDPPGTSINRLVVVGEQITPDPSSNVASKVNQTTAAKPKELPSNAPSLWQRLTDWLTS